MHREGLTIVLALAITALLLTLIYRTLGGGFIVRGLSVLCWATTAMAVFFFRDPERVIPNGKGEVVSPADGTVIGIDEVEEPLFLQGRARRVSIFLSVFNVHVNRVPVEGTVKLVQYHRGRFHVASLPQASSENEQSVIGVESPWGRVLFKQIAGLIARRIVYDVREGLEVRRGERFGIIKFGSRMEVYLPLDTEIKVRLNEKVRAGESIIGEFKNAA
ncbi:phosphatidylserine decarboxylase family protein [bacterium]|nr:phosphatidylserine decarboxylase family protein [bacterium]